ncbi:MAG: hypothetical protein LUG18_05885 [Candidatus Azobacteroides sp.]|nr:hypothetical protein [Candidatus Azobacteroides sp.]
MVSAQCRTFWQDVLNKTYHDKKIDLSLSGHMHTHSFHEPGSGTNEYPVCVAGGYTPSSFMMPEIERETGTDIIHLRVYDINKNIVLFKSY